ncbi:hypothetical protein BDY19DRAFT_91490 [Irpex rosettiformis]|uniref:Uncharacterized protein n=1 Tax=Irpex rosettiformis TaxID=378272 RepID=A0ACB8U688_9APHY|nr:hypothetical protein BDY19DRAFT_91490 [Irpex rosettiformis]
MAPIHITATTTGYYMPTQATHLSFWLIKSSLLIFGTLSVSLAALVLVWAARKTKKSISASNDRLQERKLFLPTHLNPRILRPIVLPLPEKFLSTKQDDGSSPPWASPIKDTHVSHHLEDLTVVDDNDDLMAGSFCSLAPTVSFMDDLYYVDLEACDPSNEKFNAMESHTSLCDMDIPTIVITEDTDNTGSHYSYESPTLVSTPSTAVLYQLGLPTTVHEFPTSRSHAPIPISFSPRLNRDRYIYVPPPGSTDYFHSFASIPH